MVDTFTPSLRLTEPEISANFDAWAALLNTGMIGLLDDAIAGETVVDVTAGNVTLTRNDGATDQARAMFIRVIGTPGTTRFITTSLSDDVPSKLYIVTNDSDSTVTLSPGGTGLAVNAGAVAMMYGVTPSLGMFEITQVGDYIEELGGTTLGQLTLDILPTPGGGDVTVSCQFLIQPSFVFLTFDAFNSTAVPGTTFSVLPTGGDWDVVVPAGDQGLVPFVSKAFPVNLYEDTGGGMLPVPSILAISTVTTTPWTFTRVDGAAYTNPSARQILRPTTVFYPRQVNV